MIRVKFTSSGQQISKVCNHCGCHIDDLVVEDILVKPKWANSDNMTFRDKDGNEITRTELPNDLVNSVCEDCE